MAIPKLIDVSDGAIEVTPQQFIPGADISFGVNGGMVTSYNQKWDTDPEGLILKGVNSLTPKTYYAGPFDADDPNFVPATIDPSELIVIEVVPQSQTAKPNLYRFQDEAESEERLWPKEFQLTISTTRTPTRIGAFPLSKSITINAYVVASFSTYYPSTDSGITDKLFVGIQESHALAAIGAQWGEIDTREKVTDLFGNGSFTIGSGFSTQIIHWSVDHVALHYSDSLEGEEGQAAQVDHYLGSYFHQDICILGADSESSASRILALNDDNCIVETTVSGVGGSALGTDYINLDDPGSTYIFQDPTTNLYVWNAGDFRIRAGSGVGEEHDYIVELADTAVTAGDYTNANISVDRHGRITAAASGSSGATVSSLPFDANTETSLGSGEFVAAITHSLSSQRPSITIYQGNEVVIPMSITITNSTTITLTFNQAVSGTAVLVG